MLFDSLLQPPNTNNLDLSAYSNKIEFSMSYIFRIEPVDWRVP